MSGHEGGGRKRRKRRAGPDHAGSGGPPSGPDHPQDERKPERQGLGSNRLDVSSRSIILTAEKGQAGERGSREKDAYEDDLDWEVAGWRDARLSHVSMVTPRCSPPPRDGPGFLGMKMRLTAILV